MLINHNNPSIDRLGIAGALATHVLTGGFLGEGRKTLELEAKLARIVGAKYSFMVNNGTTALLMALLVAGVKAGDEVLVPDLTMVATMNVVRLIGAIPVPVDVEEKTLCLDISRAQLSDKTKAMIYVTFNGRGVHKRIQQFCDDNKLFLINDDAQSLGSSYTDGYMMGSKELCCMSFALSKIVTTGQGGCLFTRNADIAEKIHRLKNFGRLSSSSDDWSNFGINAKFSDLLSIVGLNQLKSYKKKVEYSKKRYEMYRYLLKADVKFIPTELRYYNPWMTDIYVDNRKEVMEFLRDCGIETRPIFSPMHSILGLPDWDYKVATEYSKKGIYLPNCELEDVDYVCDRIKEIV